MGGSSPARRLNPTRIAVTHQDSLFVDIYRRYAPHSAYDVFPNGREFLLTRGSASTGSQLFVITNWQQTIGSAAPSTVKP